MTTNEICGEIHDHIIIKVKEQCSIDGNNKKAIALADDLMAYAKTISEAFADDGRISDIEEAKIDGAFRIFLDKNVPTVGGMGVSLAWNGINLIVWSFKGIKHYLNKWFNLGL